MLIWHIEANKILDMKERADQVAYYRSLPPDIRETVGELVRMQQGTWALLGWRATWLREVRK